MWSFQFKFSDDSVLDFGGKWRTSENHFTSWESAWEAAGKWAHACFENDMPVDIRLVKVG